MDLRIFTEPQQGGTYEQLLRVATATEDLGFDAFFRSDHYLAMGGDGLPGPTDAWIPRAGLARETTGLRPGPPVPARDLRLAVDPATSVAQCRPQSGLAVPRGRGAGRPQRGPVARWMRCGWGCGEACTASPACGRSATIAGRDGASSCFLRLNSPMRPCPSFCCRDGKPP